MLIFISIALASFLVLAGSFFFGHDHDTDHAEPGHPDAGHDLSHDAEPAISFFSVKTIATLTMGFGAAGTIARQYGADYLVSSLWGLGTGILLSLLMYLMLKLIYRQQSTSLVQTASTIGSTAMVTISIDAEAPGQVSLELGGQYLTFIASSSRRRPIPKGRSVKVVNVVGSELVVEETGSETRTR
jgi:membrane-bound ClpP family serine protease